MSDERTTLGRGHRAGSSSTFYGAEMRRVARITVPLWLAGHRFDDVLAEFPEGKSRSGRENLIGMDLLKEFVLSFDLSQRVASIEG